ncbi:hypothetical protein J4421_02130 [Candidatus Woesearchaeota archaeon]|nr:hypothetical protein [Candidatus Woesearchaeota archaeon]
MAKDELKDLPPEERIKRLKRLEEEKKKEIEEAEKIIKESHEEITERRKWIEKVPIPQVAQDDLEGLGEEGKQLFKAHRGKREEAAKEEKEPAPFPRRREDEALEEAIAREAVRFRPAAAEYRLPQAPLPQQINAEYVAQLSTTPAEQLQQRMETVYGAVEKRGYMTWQEQQFVQETMSALEKKAEAVQAGRYTLSEQAAEAAMVTREVASKMLHNQYKSLKDKEQTRHSWYESAG